MTKETVISLMLSVFPLESGMFLRILGIYSTFTSQIMRYIKICKNLRVVRLGLLICIICALLWVMMGSEQIKICILQTFKMP